MQTRLREWRRRRMLTQRELAEAAGVGWMTVARIETGKTDPHFSTLRKLAKALKIKPTELVAEEQQAALAS